MSKINYILLLFNAKVGLIKFKNIMAYNFNMSNETPAIRFNTMHCNKDSKLNIISNVDMVAIK